MLARAVPRGGLLWLAAPILWALALGVAGGVGLVALSPLVLFGTLGGLVVAALMLRSPQAALLVFIVVSLLPFGVIPLRLGVQLTLIDATLTLALLVVVLRLLRSDAALVTSPLD